MSQSKIERWMRRAMPLGRDLDPRYPSNLFIGVVVVAAFASTLILDFVLDTELDLWRGAGTALATLAAWTIGRELDPDHATSANIAALLTVPGVWIWNMPALWGLFGLLLTMRILNRTTGLLPGPGGITATLVLIALSDHSLFALLVMGALLIDNWLPDPDRPFNLVGAGVALVIAALLQPEIDDDWQLGIVVTIAAVGVGAAYLITIWRALPTFTSLTDHSQEPLDYRRVRAGQLLAVIAVLAFMTWAGDEGVVALLPVWAAMVGVVLRSIGAPAAPSSQ